MTVLEHGILRGYDAGTHTATVQITGSLASYLGGVKVARNIASAEMVAGRSCIVAFLDAANPEDGAVIAVYG